MEIIPNVDSTNVNILSSIFFVLWRRIFRQPKLDHLVLCVCESVEGVNQFLKGVGKEFWYFVGILKKWMY